jgi:hypothetical protein
LITDAEKKRKQKDNDCIEQSRDFHENLESNIGNDEGFSLTDGIPSGQQGIRIDLILIDAFTIQ